MILYFLMMIFQRKVMNENPRSKNNIKQHHQHQRNNKRRLIPINVNTRNVDHYQQLGILYDGHTTLPLLGRRIHTGSHKWNYYTLTNSNIAIKIPLTHKNRDCLDQYGCDELYEDDDIIIPEFNNSKFRIKMYDRSPRYIPF